MRQDTKSKNRRQASRCLTRDAEIIFQKNSQKATRYDASRMKTSTATHGRCTDSRFQRQHARAYGSHKTRCRQTDAQRRYAYQRNTDLFQIAYMRKEKTYNTKMMSRRRAWRRLSSRSPLRFLYTAKSSRGRQKTSSW